MGGRVGTRTRTKARAQRPLRSMRVWDEVTSTVQRLFQEEAVGADTRPSRPSCAMSYVSLRNEDRARGATLFRQFRSLLREAVLLEVFSYSNSNTFWRRGSPYCASPVNTSRLSKTRAKPELCVCPHKTFTRLSG